MRLADLLTESEVESVVTDAMDFVVAAYASGMDELDTQALVNELQQLGHSVTPESLVDMFSDDRPEVIKNITVDTVQLDLDVPEPVSSELQAQSQQRRVSSQAMQNIRRRSAQSRRVAGDL